IHMTWRLDLYDSSRIASVKFWEERDTRGVLRFSSIDIRDFVVHQDLWSCHLGADDCVLSIYDSRNGPFTRTTMPPAANQDLVSVPSPDFGEFEGLVQCTRAVLRRAGYGE